MERWWPLIDTIASDKSLLTLRELAQRLRVSEEWIHVQVDAGRLPTIACGAHRLFDWEAVRLALWPARPGSPEPKGAARD